MLTQAPVVTILPVKDMDRARDFYEKRLGLTPQGARPDGKFLFRCNGGATLAIFPKPEGTKAEHTAVSFVVDDIVAEIRDLKAHGVQFHDYDFPGFKTVERTVTIGAQWGQLDLNTMLPVMGYNLAESIRLLARAATVFADKALDGLTANADTCLDYIEISPSMATALNPLIGYDKAAEIAKRSYRERRPVREVLGLEVAAVDGDEVGHRRGGDEQSHLHLVLRLRRRNGQTCGQRSRDQDALAAECFHAPPPG